MISLNSLQDTWSDVAYLSFFVSFSLHILKPFSKSFLKTINCYIAYIQVPGRSIFFIFFIEDGKKVQAG